MHVCTEHVSAHEPLEYWPVPTAPRLWLELRVLYGEGRLYFGHSLIARLYDG
jgi:hypothetical protein